MVCKQCGKDLPDGSTFCKYCGAVLWEGSGNTSRQDLWKDPAAPESAPAVPVQPAQSVGPYSYPAAAGYSVQNTGSYIYPAGTGAVKRKTSVWSIVVMSVLGGLLLLVSFFTVISLFTVGTQDEAIAALEQQVADLEADHDQLYDELIILQDKVDFYDGVIVFVLDDGTELYHSFDCDAFLNSDEDFWAFNIEQAKGLDYIPCPQCQAE